MSFLDDPQLPDADPEPAPPAATAGEGAAPALMYESADQWLREWMLPNWRPPLGELKYRWCPRWWLHPEAVNRIEALWRAWEHLRNDGLLGASVWWRDHFTHHWGTLTGTDGPFAACKNGDHKQADPLQAPPAVVNLSIYI
ncbi:DUF4913 domain-containing protein [Aestuariimicrobium sp. T2.26MG-19.2B]|uniref:DUF4913 domain-containing protein n=1 Tax=Aestuariimicrobium sp. T2.26MG-19.2B TaxID=3040679 RepID=UPI0024775615|nr:DUF4913 domain-containing protein [Aestuariimicrobium sp. T2.26MG-19.2B]CAI9411746.1 hypothetical protein AESSP_02712 [Aestuariimicrobium sp. T2.26MG-19.2B]